MEATRKDEIKKIWRECFDDTPEYVEMYFNRVYSERDALTLEKGERIVSSLLLQPYSFRFQGTDVTIGYIAGAATRRNARGKGYMSELMVGALDEAARRGYMAVALIPASDALYFFYDRFDFSTVFYYDPQRFTGLHAFTPVGHYTSVDDVYADDVYSAFRAFEESRPCGVLHTRRDFLNILDDLGHDGGKFFALRSDDGAVVSMAFATPSDDRVIVKELLGVDADAREAALAAVRERWLGVAIGVFAPAHEAKDEGNGRRLNSRGMARIVNVPLCLGIVAAANPRLRLAIRVTDRLMPANTHTYIIKDGMCAISDDAPRRLDFDVDIDTLNKIVFSAPEIGEILGFPSQRPNLRLMLD